MNDFKSKKCQECGLVYYFNCAAATAAFITDNERLLVARRAKDPAKGTFDLPGGFVDTYESAEEALRREIREETGLRVNNLQYLFSLPNIYSYSGIDVHTLDLFYQYNIDGDLSILHPNDDVAELLFVEKNALRPELFGLDSIRQAIKIWLEQYFRPKIYQTII
jgi:ADP-ribose pyrophosphatase YjhB (NUDIX family)